MIRCTFCLFVYFLCLASCDDVEISEDEQPSYVDTVASTDDNEHIGSEDMDALLAFVEPSFGLAQSAGPVSLFAGKPSSIIVSLENTNSGSDPHSFTLTSIESALHYPRYYSYYIQNFTTKRLYTVLEPSQQVSISYTFTPSIQLASQHFDLAVIVNYQDQSGTPYAHSLFNNTVTLLELDEGMDTELIFLGILVLSLGVLFILGLWHWISKKSNKRQIKTSATSGPVDEIEKNEYTVKTRKSNSSSKVDKPERENGALKRRQGKK